MDSYIDVLRRHSTLMEPVATGMPPKLAALEGVRAVLFDVYGTMFISASGDVGTVAAAPAEAFAAAIEAIGLEIKSSGGEGASALVAAIEKSHRAAHERGVDYP